MLEHPMIREAKMDQAFRDGKLIMESKQELANENDRLRQENDRLRATLKDARRDAEFARKQPTSNFFWTVDQPN
jgi:regulator of replication initiation timing